MALVPCPLHLLGPLCIVTLCVVRRSFGGLKGGVIALRMDQILALGACAFDACALSTHEEIADGRADAVGSRYVVLCYKTDRQTWIERCHRLREVVRALAGNRREGDIGPRLSVWSWFTRSNVCQRICDRSVHAREDDGCRGWRHSPSSAGPLGSQEGTDRSTVSASVWRMDSTSTKSNRRRARILLEEFIKAVFLLGITVSSPDPW